MNAQTNLNLESKIENENMSFGSVFRSMIPSVIAGTLASVGCQEICSSYTDNPTIVTSAGMTGQFVASYLTYFAAYLKDNMNRLKSKDGKINWKQYGQEISSVLVSDRVGNSVWAGAYGLTNGLCLNNNFPPSWAGTISGVVSGLIYSAFTGLAAPKVNDIINYIKKLKSKISCM